MKALRLIREDGATAPTLVLQDVPKPTLIPGHIIVKVHASAIHPSDIMNYKGGFPYTTYPRTPGRDFAGTVVEGPSNRIGEEVYGTSGSTIAFTTDGYQAEYCLVPEDAVAPKPKTLSKAHTKKEDVVLVTGANGAVGSAVVQLGKSMGCRVLSATRSDRDDVNTASDPELNAIDKLTGGKGVDVVADTVGLPAITQAAVNKLAFGGRLSFIAAPKSGDTGMKIDMQSFYRQEKSLVGCNTLKYSVEEFAEEMRGLTARFEDGSLEGAKAGVWTEVQLEDGFQAYEKASQPRAGKFVIVMN
ncbi:Zinc-type alcohol dehydrogenase protein [Rutstroemia sp. NJR-2017a BBW]|nr:Zinc-type alcohol dehydrogenase protein [Rutstroemia sp. NJR-2017a BBW]